MVRYHKIFLDLVEDFSKHELVEGILLSGSRTTGNYDENSDYDLYIYSNEEIPLKFREKIAKKYFNYVELNNTTWEREDQGIFKEIEVQIDLVYRDLHWIDSILEKVVMQGNASTGYTTCFWHNISKSKILYDKNNKMQELKDKYDVEYPKKLQKNIINKNFPLLDEIIPAYTNQVAKALKRDDYISVNHRVAAFFESYFDILFAINRKLHPGEKKLLKITRDLDKTPVNMESDIEDLFQNLFNKDYDVVEKLEDIAENMKVLLKKEGFGKI